jgi:tRNA(His) 5'-end guanylyltransferase
MAETDALTAYTQSDEISLVWHQTSFDSEPFFGGRVFKMITGLASMASVRFNKLLPKHLPEKADREPTFDCRAWNVPNRTEAANSFLFRTYDASRNSILAVGQANFSQRQLFKKNSGDIKAMLLSEKGIDFERDFSADLKWGVWLQRRKVSRPFTTDELQKLPAKHEARQNPDLVVERHEIRCVEMPEFVTVLNREEAIFEGAEPVTNGGVSL